MLTGKSQLLFQLSKDKQPKIHTLTKDKNI